MIQLPDQLADYVPVEIVDRFRAYIHAGEAVLVMETLCDDLYDNEISLHTADVSNIQGLARRLGVTWRSCELITELVQE